MSKFWQLFLRLLVPLAWAIALHLAPRPAAYDTALLDAWRARLQSQIVDESQALRQLVSFEPWRGDRWERLGELAFQSQAWDQAIEAYRQAEQNTTLSLPGRKSLGEAYWKQGDQETAIHVWQPLLHSSGDASLAMFQQVYEYQRSQGMFVDAIQTLTEWKDIEPANAQVLYNLGILLLYDHPEDGINWLNQAVKADANLTEQVYGLREAFQAETNTSLLKGQTLARVGEWDQAALFYKNSTTETPNSAEAWAYLGEAQDQTGQSGTDAFEQALDLDPTSIPARAGAALHWRRQGNLERSRAYLQSLAEEQPDQPVWQLEIGNTLAQTGKLGDALGYYQRALELEPSNAYYWSVLAAFCSANGYDLRGTGLPAARQALLLSPDNAEYLDTLGVIFMQLEDFTSAERFLQHAEQKDARLAPVHLHLGQLYLYQGRMDLAYQNLTQTTVLAGQEGQAAALAKRLLDRYFSGATGATKQP